MACPDNVGINPKNFTKLQSDRCFTIYGIFPCAPLNKWFSGRRLSVADIRMCISPASPPHAGVLPPLLQGHLMMVVTSVLVLGGLE